MELPEQFNTQWIDFKKGIRVGHLEEDQRITQILKKRLLKLFNEDFLIDHWGRGLFWSYIWFCPRKNLKAKNFKGPGQFPSAKYFIGVDSNRRLFVAGFYVESGYNESEEPRYQRNSDWDWNRFVVKLKKDSVFQKEVQRLMFEEDFELAIGFEENLKIFDKQNFKDLEPVCDEINKRLNEDWVVVQIYYPLSEKELKSMNGAELIQAIMGIWSESAGLMNACLRVPLSLTRPITMMKSS
jgi:hypothetical protein